MSTTVVVDASVWVSWLIISDVNHESSLLWIVRYLAEGGLLVAPSLMLVEVAAAISRQLRDIDLARETVKNLSDASEIQIASMDTTLSTIKQLFGQCLRLASRSYPKFVP